MKTKLFVLLFILPTYVECANGTQAKALQTRLFDGYNKKIRPAENQHDATEVYVSFNLLAINKLDEVAETMKTTGFLVIEWKDEFLQWDPADYGGIDLYHFPQEDVWKPDVALKNSAEKYKSLGLTSLNVQVDNYGAVFWNPFEVFESTCSIDITYFPFDTQICKLNFVAWSYSAKEVAMEGGSRSIGLGQFSPNSEWDLIDTVVSVEKELGEASIIYTLKIKRKPRYIIFSIILPIVMLAALDLFVFVLPCNSGKVSYAMTVFLSHVVFLTIISSSLPRNSETVSIFSVYIIILTVQSTLIIMMAVIVTRIWQFETPVPKIIARMTNFLFCKFCRKERNTVIPEGVQSSSNGSMQPTEDFIAIKMPRENLDKSNNWDENPTQDMCDWKKVTNGLDRLLFCFFTFVTLIATLVCLIYASTAAV